MADKEPHPLIRYNERMVARERSKAEGLLRQAIRRRLDRIVVDGNGHEISPDILRRIPEIRFASTKPGWDTSIDELNALTDSIASGRFTHGSTHSIAIDLGFNGRCYFCGQGHGKTAPPVYRLDGNTLRAVTPCPAEEGPFTVHLPIPSGILAIGNDFWEYGEPDPDAQEDEAQAFAGESLPAERAAVLLGARRGAITVVLHEDEGGIYRRPDGTILVGRYSRLGKTEAGVPEAKNLGGYWRAFADGDLIPANVERIARVPVEPGTYAFTIHGMGLDRANFGTEEWHHPAVEIEIRRITDHGSTNA